MGLLSIEEELEETRKALQGVGVTAEDVAKEAARGIKDSLLTPAAVEEAAMPMSPKQQAIEEYGKGGYLMRKLATKIPLLTPSFVDDMILPQFSRENRTKYASDVEIYQDRAKKMAEQQLAAQAAQADRKRLSGVYDEWDAVVNDGDPTNDARGYTRAINNGADPAALALAYGSNPLFAAKTGRDLPDATRAVIHYQDSLNRYFDTETGEQKMRKPGEEGYVKYADAFDRYKNREVGGLREQAAARAAGQSEGEFGQGVKNAAPAEAATMNSAMSTIESLGNITRNEDGGYVFTPHNQGEFDDVYGSLDRFKPFGLTSEETFIRETVEKLSSILAVDARGKLKGQGQISDKETAMLERSLSILSQRGISPQRAQEELARIYSIMEKGFMEKQEIINPTQGNQGGGGSDFDTLWDGV